MWVTSCTGSAQRIWGILKKSVELISASGEDGWLSLARRSQASGLVAGATRVGGADEKVIIERLCISLPYVGWETGIESAGDVSHRKLGEDFGDFEKFS